MSSSRCFTQHARTQIDAGEAFGFDRDYSRFFMSFHPKCPLARRLADKRDLQFGNQQPKVIEWAKLRPVQRAAFLRALLRGLDFLSEQAVVDLILRRRGEFDQAVEAPRRLMTSSVVQPLAERWAECVRVCARGGGGCEEESDQEQLL
jgi:hypothetical protein